MIFDQVSLIAESDLDDSYQADISKKGNYNAILYKGGAEKKRSLLRNISLDEVRKIVPQGGRVLEVGSSTGDFVALLNDNGYEAYGIDISKFACKMARSKTSNIILDDYAKHVFDPNFFDCIFFSMVLVHIRSPRDAMRKAFGELKKGGAILVLERDWGSFRIMVKLRQLFGVSTSFRYCLNFFRPATCRKLVKKVGYKYLKTRAIGYESDAIFGISHPVVKNIFVRSLLKLLTKLGMRTSVVFYVSGKRI